MKPASECPTGKVRYATEVDAGIALDFMRGVPSIGRARPKPKKGQKRRRGPRSVYACPHCGGWHLTSLGQRSARARGAQAAAARGHKPWVNDQTQEKL